MKYTINKIILGATAVLALGLSSCEKTFDEKIELKAEQSNTATVQVFIATVNAARNYVYVDAKPVNGAALVSGNLFPANGIGISVQPGLRNMMVRDTLSTTRQTQLSFAQNMQAGMGYTVFMYDTITSVKQKTVETHLIVPSDTSCRIRFANFAYNGNAATPAIDVVSTGKNEVVATNVPYTGVTEFVAHPTGLAGEGFQIRLAGTSTVLASITTATLNPKRSYTVVYRGSHRSTTSTGRTATLFVNY
jgi:hypothetical protein